MRDADVVIIGAGLAGLAAAVRARELGLRPVVLEAAATAGGLARSFRQDGFTFDCSGHLLHLKRPATQELVSRVTSDDDWAMLERKSAVFMRDALIPYPFQAHLAFAPPDVRDECVEGLPATAPSPTPDSDAVTLADWIRENLGAGIGRHFMVPYNEKLTTVGAEELVATALGRFLPTPALEEIRRGAEIREETSTGYNAVFRYPARGGIDLLWEGLYEKVRDVVVTSSAASSIDHDRQVVFTEAGEEYRYTSALISSAPLPEMCRMTGDADLAELAGRMRASSVTCVNLGVQGVSARFAGLQWLYLPEREFTAYRIGFYSGLVPTMAPEGCDAVYVEISHNGQLEAAAAVDSAIRDMIRLGAITERSQVRSVLPVDIKYGYVTHDQHHKYATRRAIAALQEMGVHMIGRYGRWEYAAMEDALGQGLEAAEAVATQVAHGKPS